MWTGDPAQDLWQIYTLGVSHSGAVAVGDVGVDSQDGVGAAQQVRAARIAEAGAALALGWIGGQAQVPVAVHEIAGDELCKSVQAHAQAGPDRGTTAVDLLLDAITDQVDVSLIGQAIDQAFRRQGSVLVYHAGRDGLAQYDDTNITHGKAGQAIATTNAETGVV